MIDRHFRGVIILAASAFFSFLQQCSQIIITTYGDMAQQWTWRSEFPIIARWYQVHIEYQTFITWPLVKNGNSFLNVFRWAYAWLFTEKSPPSKFSWHICWKLHITKSEMSGKGIWILWEIAKFTLFDLNKSPEAKCLWKRLVLATLLLDN